MHVVVGWKYYLVYVAVIIIQIPILYFLFPETKGLTVEEVKVLFEGEQVLSTMPDSDKMCEFPLSNMSDAGNIGHEKISATMVEKL